MSDRNIGKLTGEEIYLLFRPASGSMSARQPPGVVQAGAFARAAADVVPMPPEPTFQDPILAAVQGCLPNPILAQMQEYEEAARHNIQVYQRYCLDVAELAGE